ncbi:MAG: hypothetical protein ABW275_02510 [Hansschlegelia sp.]
MLGAVLLIATVVVAATMATGEPDDSRWPSIVTLPVSTVDPSIESLPPVGDGATPSIVALPDTPADAATSIVSLGEPATETSEEASPSVTVIRGGEIGGELPPAEPAPEPLAEPLLDPNDRGTPAKRRALREQEERLAREALEAQEAAEPQQPSDETSGD